MKRLGFVVLALVAGLLATGAAATAKELRPASGAVPARAAGEQGAVKVRFQIKRFVTKAHGLYANGVATATYVPQQGQPTVVQKPFTAKVLVGSRRAAAAYTPGRAARICPVLFLQLDKLSLNLLGLHVDLDKVVLNISANSKGGALGSLFCQLARTRVKLLHGAGALTSIAHQSGLATSGIQFGIPVQSQQQSSQQAASCQVLDLVLGPLHLNLLGLIVDLSQVHLTITADPNGGTLGSMFCQLAK
jgi:hypothetical protein